MGFTGVALREISDECFAGLQRIFDQEPDSRYAARLAHGRGAGQLFSPGDKVRWSPKAVISRSTGVAGRSLRPSGRTLPNDWRRAIDRPARKHVCEDKNHEIKAVLTVTRLDWRLPPGRGDAQGDRRGGHPALPSM